LHVHRSGLCGSPRVSGSISRSNACSRPGSVSRRRLGPSCWRMRPRGSAGWSSSAALRRTVGRDASAKRATRLTPIPQRPGRRTKQQPTLPLGQVRSDQREGRCPAPHPGPHREPTTTAHPGKVTKRGYVTSDGRITQAALAWPTGARATLAAARSMIRRWSLRVVSLLPSATEIICALGAGEELVGSPTSATTRPRWPSCRR
jgi:hypothetical protein